MKKFIALALCLISLTASAQSTIVNNPANKTYFGLRVGGELTCPGDISSDGVSVDIFKLGGGIEFGGILNAPIIANFYIEPGLNFYYNSYALNDKTEYEGILIRKWGMRIPVMAGYHFDFTDDVKLSVFTGPELEVGFVADANYKNKRESVSEDIYGDDGIMQRVDLLWDFGVGITYKHVYFGVKGGIGMLDMLSVSRANFHENRVTFSLGYNF